MHVVVFISHECPIANGYAPTLGELHEQWAQEPRVEMFLVHVDPDFDAEAAIAHQQDYQLPGPVLLDPEQVLAKACGATITPEAVVVTSEGIAYRGRIDDQWRKLGSRARRPASATSPMRSRTCWPASRLPRRSRRPSAACCRSRATSCRVRAD